jgi:hypothetical protein
MNRGIALAATALLLYATAHALDVKLTVAETNHVASAEYCAATGAAPGLFAAPDVRTDDRDCDGKLDAWMRSTRCVADPASPASLSMARRTSCLSSVCYVADNTHGYGWMDFGGLPGIGRGAVTRPFADQAGDAGVL